MRYLNLGILAHVDAGKTSLTERLLFTNGVIDRMGSVDAGSTQTDSLALERQRGITIKAAVVSFVIGDVTVNLIDTPGHPDFIAEVERVLGVLDGAVLVISAVEGVQAQTRVLMRALQRLRIPTLLFINKIDRSGADVLRVLEEIAAKLTPAIVPMSVVHEPGTRNATVHPIRSTDADAAAQLLARLAEHDDALLTAYVNGGGDVSEAQLLNALALQTQGGLVHPVFCGSAMTGAGVEQLIDGIGAWLPTASGVADGPMRGMVFKIERGPAGEKIAYVRMFSGTLRVRERTAFGRDRAGRVTALSVFERGKAVRSEAVTAGQIGKLWGLSDVQIGDVIGAGQADTAGCAFAPPTLETVIVPQRPAERRALHTALSQLAEQDPLINLRRGDNEQAIFVSLYGEVQKEVIEATLRNEYQIAVAFKETTTICVERPVRVGAAVELMGKAPNPFAAGIGLRIEPAPIGTGLSYRLDVATHGKMPIAFFNAVEEAVHETLQQGLYGWQVTDCSVTLTHAAYNSVSSTAGDYRNLAPLVVMDALKQAATQVYEPMHRFELEIPNDALGRVTPALGRLRAVPEPPVLRGAVCRLTGVIPAAQIHELQTLLPGLSRGEGVMESTFERYDPVNGPTPVRQRTDHNPLNWKEYLIHVVRRV